MHPQYRWQHEPRRELTLVQGVQALWSFNFSTARRKAYFHPLHTPKGVLLSCFEPSDHVWHRGLWFAWKYLNGVNYWEEREPVTEPEGRTEFAGGETVELHSDRAAIETRYRYCPPGGDAILEETRRIVAGMPRADSSYTLDWRQTFAATREDVKIDCTPINAQTPWGGYSGLSWRAARTLVQFQALNSEGVRDKECEHRPARWVDLTGLADGGRDLFAGLAMFDHPQNPRHPSPWRCVLEPGNGYINPAFMMREPWVIEPGAPLVLRYRVLVHDGVPDAVRFEKEWQAFAATE